MKNYFFIKRVYYSINSGDIFSEKMYNIENEYITRGNR